MRKLTLAIIDDRGQLAEDPGGWAVPITNVTQQSASQDRQQLAATLDHGRNHLGRAKPMAPQGCRFAVAVVHDHPKEAFGVVIRRAAIGECFAGKARG